jgi:hypothetical protein
MEPMQRGKFQCIGGQSFFTIQCNCLGDWLKVEQEGPWLIHQNAVITEPYDGLTKWI